MAKRTVLIAQAAALTAVLSNPAMAVEGGTSFYLLGSKTTMAGYLPAPGFYGILQNYAYSGSADIDFETAGLELSGGIEADAYIALPTAMWVLDQDILGGNLAFALTTPFGGKKMEAGAILDLAQTTKELDAERDNWAFGDPVLGSTLGWHDGNMHYSIGVLVNVPIGQWELGNPVNIGFNRWVIDTTAAVTYLNPQTKIELSGAAGLTFNFQNPDTDYKSGTEFHVEGAAMFHPSHTFSFGLNGYALKQITEDSGSGAVLGGFEGQVFALGPAIDFTFHVGNRPVITNLRYFQEFGVDNRLEGQAGFLNFVVPLGALPAAHAAE
jgi:hypothetical protein